MKNISPDSSRFCSLQIDTKFTTQTSKCFMFNSILSNQKQSPKCHRQLNTQWMNAMHAIVTLKSQNSSHHRLPVFHECSAGCLIFNFHAWEFIIVTIIAFNCLWHFGDCFWFDGILNSFEVWIVNLVSVCGEQNGLLSGWIFFLKKSITLDF